MRKTGLGSSATLVSSLITSLLLYFNVLKDQFDENSNKNELNPENMGKIFNLSQIIHSYAQGKVGSGFDVSSATYGSQMYSRFSPDIISDFFSIFPKKNCENFLEIFGKLENIVESTWDQEIRGIHLPPGLALTLGDVSIGANTPSMVSKLFAWRSRFPDQGSLFLLPPSFILSILLIFCF